MTARVVESPRERGGSKHRRLVRRFLLHEALRAERTYRHTPVAEDARDSNDWVLGVPIWAQAAARPERVQIVGCIPLRYREVVEAAKHPPDYGSVRDHILAVGDGGVHVPVVEAADVHVHIGGAAI